jgi:hypothetical protein
MRGRRPLSPPEVVRFCAFSFAAAGVGMSLDAACFPFFVRALPFLCRKGGALCEFGVGGFGSVGIRFGCFLAWFMVMGAGSW